MTSTRFRTKLLTYYSENKVFSTLLSETANKATMPNSISRVWKFTACRI